MKTLRILIAGVALGGSVYAADPQPPIGRFALAIRTDGGSLDAAFATIKEAKESPPTIEFKFLGVEWHGPISFQQITTGIVEPGSPEPYRSQAFYSVLTGKDESRVLAISGDVGENGVLTGKMVFLIGGGVRFGVPLREARNASSGIGTFVMRPENGAE
jgi:hypothetical protein